MHVKFQRHSLIAINAGIQMLETLENDHGITSYPAYHATQDIVEQRFSRYRAANGQNDNPSALQFLQIACHDMKITLLKVLTMCQISPFFLFSNSKV